MNYGPLIFLGIFASLLTSFWGMIFVSQLQVGKPPPPPEGLDQPYPVNRPGLARQGQQVYVAQGCVYCHTQLVRPRGWGPDLEAGWGERRTVAQDYLYDQPIQTGNLRVGPDLANFGARQTNDIWILQHIYKPQLHFKDSTMPPYPFLFEKHRPGEVPSPAAIFVEDGSEIIPKPEAYQLTAYLRSLEARAPVFEVPLPPTSTNAPASDAEGATNAVPANANTNATPGTDSPKP